MLNTRLCRLMSLSIGEGVHLSTTKIQLVFVVFPVENARTRGSKTLDRHEMRTVRSLALLQTTANHSMSPARQNNRVRSDQRRSKKGLRWSKMIKNVTIMSKSYEDFWYQISSKSYQTQFIDGLIRFGYPDNIIPAIVMIHQSKHDIYGILWKVEIFPCVSIRCRLR